MSFLDAFLAPWTDHPSELRELRLEMASTKDVVARLAAATDELANDLSSLRGRIADQDSALAAELDPIVSRLESLGQDPKDPVPDAPSGPVVNPSDNGSTPADQTGDRAPSQDGGLAPGEVSPEDVPDQNASDQNL
jgi:hypothetical protein